MDVLFRLSEARLAGRLPGSDKRDPGKTLLRYTLTANRKLPPELAGALSNQVNIRRANVGGLGRRRLTIETTQEPFNGMRVREIGTKMVWLAMRLAGPL